MQMLNQYQKQRWIWNALHLVLISENLFLEVLGTQEVIKVKI